MFEEACNIGQDIDWMSHVEADENDVKAYNTEHGEGPDPTDLRFDMAGGIQSSWNQWIFKMLCERATAACEQGKIAIPDDVNLMKQITRKFTRGKVHWNVAQPQWKDGKMESEIDVGLRVQASLKKAGDKARASTRRQSVSGMVR